jgi:Na+/H+ antiporter NhaD/arsenite permease-like protein
VEVVLARVVMAFVQERTLFAKLLWAAFVGAASAAMLLREKHRG